MPTTLETLCSGILHNDRICSSSSSISDTTSVIMSSECRQFTSSTAIHRRPANFLLHFYHALKATPTDNLNHTGTLSGHQQLPSPNVITLVTTLFTIQSTACNFSEHTVLPDTKNRTPKKHAFLAPHQICVINNSISNTISAILKHI